MDESWTINQRHILSSLGRLNVQTVSRVIGELSQLNITTTNDLNQLSETIFSVCREPGGCSLFAELIFQLNTYSDKNWKHYFVAKAGLDWIWFRDVSFLNQGFVGPCNSKDECIALAQSGSAMNDVYFQANNLEQYEYLLQNNVVIRIGYCKDDNSWYSQSLPVDPLSHSITSFPTAEEAEIEATKLFTLRGQIIDLCRRSLIEDAVTVSADLLN